MKILLNEKSLKKIAEKVLLARKSLLINCGGSVFLNVAKNGVMTFSVRIISNKKDTRVSIGHYPQLTLAEARKKAKEIKKENSKKANSEDSENYPLLCDYFFKQWFPRKAAKYKSGSTRPQNLKALFNRTIEPSGLSKYRLNEINAKLVCDCIRKVNQTDGNKHNAVSLLNQICQQAFVEGIIDSNKIANLLSGRDSPFPKPKVVGYKFVAPDLVIEKFLSPLAVTSKINMQFYLLLVLTGFRFNECRNLRWSWCQLDKNVVIIPADAIQANKTQTEYCKPLTKQTKQLLINIKSEEKTDNSDFVFKSDFNDKPICEASLREPIKTLTTRELDPHGIRKSMRTWFSSQSIPVNISELALQHDVRSQIEKVYDKYKYTEEVRAALQKWNDYICKDLPENYSKLLK